MREGGRAREIETERGKQRQRENEETASFHLQVYSPEGSRRLALGQDEVRSFARVLPLDAGSQAPDTSSVAFPRPPAGAGLATEQPAFLLASLQEADVSGHLLSLLYSLSFSLPLQNALCRTSKLDLWGIFLMLVMK